MCEQIFFLKYYPTLLSFLRFVFSLDARPVITEYDRSWNDYRMPDLETSHRQTPSSIVLKHFLDVILRNEFRRGANPAIQVPGSPPITDASAAALPAPSVRSPVSVRAGLPGGEVEGCD